MVSRTKKELKIKRSIEDNIKQAIILLGETPGSTFNAIAEYIKKKWNRIERKQVLETMKIMRRTGQIDQIKCYFRITQQAIRKELRKFKNSSSNSNKRGRKLSRVDIEENKKSKHTLVKNGVRVNSEIKTQIIKWTPKLKKKEGQPNKGYYSKK